VDKSKLENADEKNIGSILDLLKKKREESIINKEKTIYIERIQINTNNPAIARVVIRFPDKLKNKIDDIFQYFYDKYHSRNIVSKFMINDEGWIVEVKSNMDMYRWLEVLIVDYKSYIKRHYPEYEVKNRGVWDKFNRFPN
jgi:hypothetical protein